MAFTVVYDACTLYPAPLRDLLMRLAQSGIVRARWSERILDECFRNIAEHHPDLSHAALARTRALMCDAVADCLVIGYEQIERAVDLPDDDDRHVVAAAIRCGAQTIGISVQAVVKAVADQSESLRSPPVSVARLLDTLRDRGLEQSVSRLRAEFELMG